MKMMKYPKLHLTSHIHNDYLDFNQSLGEDHSYGMM